MSAPSSPVVLSAVGRNYNGFDIDSLASRLNLRVVRLAQFEPQLGAVVAARPLADGPALIVGSGNLSFDCEVAAAFGAPLLMLIDREGDHVDLAQAQAKRLQAVVAAAFTATELEDTGRVQEALKVQVDKVITPPVFEVQLVERARQTGAHIVLPEGEDDRILLAADKLLSQRICELTILGDPESIQNRADELGANLDNAHVIDHLKSPHLEDFAEKFAELRKKKGISLDEARETVRDVSYFATMMIHDGMVDGMVSGAAHTTAHTIRPAFQIIKTSPDVSVVSSIFLMVLRGRLWAFGDCAVNPNPTPEQLGEIAVASAGTAAQFGLDPKVAMLSYSTGASGAGPDVENTVEALEHARRIDPTLAVDGPLQFDAAVDPGVARKKMPDSEVAGRATVFVFPDLQSANIGYKTAQRTGSALAVGPILQGLNKPVNDLSRGATVPDVVNTVAVTAIQAGAK